jgi:hypothetical protein
MIDEAISLESIMKTVPDNYRNYIWTILNIDCILKKGTIPGYVYDYAKKGCGFITS